MPSRAALLTRIGDRLRRARASRRLTLRELSVKSGLSEPFLSRLERGRVSTSIANLISISSVLAVPLGDLLDNTADGGPPRDYVVARASDRKVPQAVATTGYRYEPLISGWPGQRIDAFILTFPRRNSTEVMTAHEGEELIFVLQGKIVFQLGDDEIPLAAGDCIYFKSEKPHMGRNVGGVDAKVLMVTSPGRGPGMEFGWWKMAAKKT